MLVSYRVCAECQAISHKSLEVDGRLYCSRDCYLAFCKRVFDAKWIEMLAHHENKSTNLTLVKPPKIA
jgi:hypothetical protein